MLMEWNGNTLPMLVSGAAIAFTGVVRWAVGSNMKQIEIQFEELNGRFDRMAGQLKILDSRVYDIHKRLK